MSVFPYVEMGNIAIIILTEVSSQIEFWIRVIVSNVFYIDLYYPTWHSFSVVISHFLFFINSSSVDILNCNIVFLFDFFFQTVNPTLVGPDLL